MRPKIYWAEGYPPIFAPGGSGLGFLSINNRRLWLIVFVAAALYFVVRGPCRAVDDSGDFLIVFTAARNWMQGLNPYIPADLAASAQAAGAPVPAAYFVTSPSVYLPSALPLVAPLALLPWAIAKVLWLACLLALSLWNVVALARLAKEWALPVASLLLAFAPLHTGLGRAQPSVLVCGLIFVSLFTTDPDIAGLLLGMAACIKPQLAAGFLLLALGQRQYRKLIVACVMVAVSTGIGVALIAPGWFPALNWNLREIVGSSSGLHSGPDPTSWYQLINLHILIPEALSQTPVEIILYALIVLLTIVAIRRAADHWMSAALISSATVLIGYHRFYDAQILWLGVPALLFFAQRPLSLLLCAGYAAFLVPGQTLAALWLGTRTDNAWRALVLRHETIAVVLIWTIFVCIALKPREVWHGTTRGPLRETELTSLQPL
ncbi:MAG: glycosyltransferase family 87 protein [Bryobacteraceae bacterium]